jgi:hypothetical protein
MVLALSGALGCSDETLDWSCSARAAAAFEHVIKAVESDDRSCQVNADCTLVQLNTECYVYPGGALVSQAGVEIVRSAIDSANASFCANYSRDCPGDNDIAVPAGTDSEFICLDGTCTRVPSRELNASGALLREMGDALACPDELKPARPTSGT